MSSDQFSDLEFPPLVGDIVYRDTDDSVRYFQTHAEDPYVAMGSMSRVQLKILGVHLSELQVQINRRLAEPRFIPDRDRNPANLHRNAFPEGAPDGTT